MADDGVARARRLAMIAAAKASAAEVENEEILAELVAELHNLQPQPRTRLWRADLVQRLVQRQDNRCPRCGDPLSLTNRSHHVDHVIPWSMGGGNETANIQVLHARCNLEKGAAVWVDELLDYLEGRIRNLT